MFKRKTFRGGVHPHEEKHWTEHMAIQDAPLPQQVVIPLQQHIGASSEILVKKGDRVKTGQPLSKTSAFVSVPVHATLSGEVIAVEPRPHPLGTLSLSIVIQGDGTDEWFQTLKPDPNYLELGAEEMKKRIQESGIAGMGGAAFTSHVKLTHPKGKTIDLVILNGVECEPYLTADHRLMLEKPNAILGGLKIIMRILGAKNALIGIEKNKPDAIRILSDLTRKDKSVNVLPLSVKYPQGAEKQLIKAATGREVPSGGLPMDVGCLVHNVGTALAIYDAVSSQKPLIERVLTVTGSGIQTPKNVSARIGTLFQDLIVFCDGYSSESVKLINGGPLMGISQVTDQVPVIKGTSGILVLNKQSGLLQDEQTCIGCARCVDTCPMKLVPNRIANLVEYDRIDNAQKIGLLDCIECGSCAYICPARRNLVHYIKYGKTLWAEKQRKAQ